MVSTLLLGLSLAHAAPTTLAACTDGVPALPGGMPDVQKRVVRLETAAGSGSGVVVSPDGFVLTAAHVLSGASHATVVFSDESRADAQVIRSHADADLALLRLPKTGLPCLKVASARQAVAGDVYVVGSPGGKALTGSVTRGIVSGYRERDAWVVLQTDASMNAGNSGGPVLAPDGEVAALVSFKLTGIGVEGVGFAVAAEEVGRALGVQFGASTDATIDTLTGTSTTTFTPPEPVFTNRPKSPGKPPRGNVCADVDVGADPFTGTKSLHARGADLFELDWKPGEPAVFTAFLPMTGQGSTTLALDADAYDPGGLTLDLLLADNTRIHLVSVGATGRMSGMLPVLAARFEVPVDVAEAVAASGPTFVRWTLGDRPPVDQDRSARQRDRYYRPMFACLAQTMR